MASTYSDRKNALAEISTRIQTNEGRIANSKTQVSTAVTDLSAMSTAYAAIVSDIDAALLATPDDVALQFQKAEKDQMVADSWHCKPKPQTSKTQSPGLASGSQHSGRSRFHPGPSVLYCRISPCW